MRVAGKPYRTIWVSPSDSGVVQVIDQRHLPHQFVIEDIRTSAEMVSAIRDMHVRGAPLIGVAAAYGIYLATLAACKATNPDEFIKQAAEELVRTRPTAINLKWAVDYVITRIEGLTIERKVQVAMRLASELAEMEVERCRMIGEHGVSLIERISEKKAGAPVNILTHCNAGWLACIEYGTATAPIYLAAKRGIPLHVWVDETRPRNQGANLTAYELLNEQIPHTVIVDNTGGLLMQRGEVDLVIVGTDRTARNGDVANKIGTYLKALAAFDNQIPFYVALPSSSLDLNLIDGVRDMPIEKRGEDEVRHVEGLCEGERKKVSIMPSESAALNYGFDVTPARLVTGYITEEGTFDSLELVPHFEPKSEGYLKFDCRLSDGAPPAADRIATMMACRDKLRSMDLIGVLPDGVGFGNISMRLSSSTSFAISGTKTGAMPQLLANGYVTVKRYNIKENWVECVGKINASAETLTHAAAYEARPEVMAVAHVHSKELWNRYINLLPTTAADAEYGTAEMANEISRLVKESAELPMTVVMAGHQDGIIFCGCNFEELLTRIAQAMRDA